MTGAAERGPQAAQVVEHQLAAEQTGEAQAGRDLLARREGPLEEGLLVQLDGPVVGDRENVGIVQVLELVGFEQPDGLAQGREADVPLESVQLREMLGCLFSKFVRRFP